MCYSREMITEEFICVYSISAAGRVMCAFLLKILATPKRQCPIAESAHRIANFSTLAYICGVHQVLGHFCRVRPDGTIDHIKQYILR